jgi:hypothetical protein
MYIETVPNRGSRPAVLLREGWRENGKVKKRTIANLSDWPEHKIQALAAVLKSKPVIGDIERAFGIVRSLPHGHVASVLRTVEKIKLDQALSRSRCTERDLCIAMLVARVTAPGSKLALARGLANETADSTLGQLLSVENADEDACYAAMDWLLERQTSIEIALAKRHLPQGGAIVLYDVTSTYFEGRHCPLAKLGHSRDGKRDKLQIVVGLMTNAEGCPIAVEVFDGNTGDPSTLAPQLKKLRERFAINQVVIVGDRGMITDARIREDLRGVEGLDWITCLRAPAIAKLVDRGSLQLSLFDQRDLVEIADPDYPGERLIVCKNPLLAQERTRKRRELLEATKHELECIRVAVARPSRPLRGQDRIGVRVGKVLGRFKMGKHFKFTITDDSFGFERDEAAIAAEAALDGIYVVRTTVSAQKLSADHVVGSYKSLARVERAFRSIKTVQLNIRPIHHRKEKRVRAHVLLCMLAYYVEWHMRRALAPLLFDDDDPKAAEARRRSVVAPARRSDRADAKASTKRTETGEPVHSFKSLLRNLSTIAQNRVQPNAPSVAPFDIITTPSASQLRALDLLGVRVLP